MRTSYFFILLFAANILSLNAVRIKKNTIVPSYNKKIDTDSSVTTLSDEDIIKVIENCQKFPFFLQDDVTVKNGKANNVLILNKQITGNLFNLSKENKENALKELNTMTFNSIFLYDFNFIKDTEEVNILIKEILPAVCKNRKISVFLKFANNNTLDNISKFFKKFNNSLCITYCKNNNQTCKAHPHNSIKNNIRKIFISFLIELYNIFNFTCLNGSDNVVYPKDYELYLEQSCYKNISEENMIEKIVIFDNSHKTSENFIKLYKNKKKFQYKLLGKYIIFVETPQNLIQHFWSFKI